MKQGTAKNKVGLSQNKLATAPPFFVLFVFAFLAYANKIPEKILLELGREKIHRQLRMPLGGVNMPLAILDRLDNTVICGGDHAKIGRNTVELAGVMAVDPCALSSKHVVHKGILLNIDLMCAGLTVPVSIYIVYKLKRTAEIDVKSLNSTADTEDRLPCLDECIDDLAVKSVLVNGSRGIKRLAAPISGINIVGRAGEQKSVAQLYRLIDRLLRHNGKDAHAELLAYQMESISYHIVLVPYVSVFQIRIS